MILGTRKSTDKVGLKHFADISKMHKFDGKIEFKPLIKEWIGDFNYVHNIGSKFYWFTNYEAHLGRIISFDINHPSKETWRDTIP